MKNMTTKQKVYLGIVVLGVLIVAVDRLVLSPEDSGPASAQAEAPSPPTAAAPVGAPAKRSPRDKSGKPDAAAPQGDMGRLARRLSDVATGQNIDPQASLDAFALSTTWRPVEQKPQVGTTQPDGPGPQEVLRKRARVFMETHRLDGVIVNPTSPAAIIDGKIIRIGERIGDFELVEVDARSAHFTIEGARFTLKLRDEGPGR